MELDKLLTQLQSRFPGLVVINTWGETSLFYNPLGVLKRGAYCFTFKESDGENDASSKLNRDEVAFRLNFKISKASFLEKFGEPSLPERPPKGCIITLKSGSEYDPTALDTLIPHPVYGWMSWVSVINPSDKTITSLIEDGLFGESYTDAVNRHDSNRSVIQYKARAGHKATSSG